jgi:hypothetical protein
MVASPWAGRLTERDYKVLALAFGFGYDWEEFKQFTLEQGMKAMSGGDRNQIR